MNDNTQLIRLRPQSYEHLQAGCALGDMRKHGCILLPQAIERVDMVRYAHEVSRTLVCGQEYDRVDLNPIQGDVPGYVGYVFDQVEQIAMGVLGRIDRANQQMPGRRRLSTVQSGYHVLRAELYQAEPPAHDDGNMLTLFIGTGDRGLQVNLKGQWEDVPLGYGDVLVGAGMPLVQYVPDAKALCYRYVGEQEPHLRMTFLYRLYPRERLPNGKTYEQHLAEIRGVA